MRDTYMNSEYWAEYGPNFREKYEMVRGRMRENTVPPENIPRVIMRQLTTRIYDGALSMYSRGESIDEMRSFVEEVINEYIDLALNIEFDLDFRANWQGGFGIVGTIRIVSILTLCKVSPFLIKKMHAFASKFEYYDVNYDLFFSKLGLNHPSPSELIIKGNIFRDFNDLGPKDFGVITHVDEERVGRFVHNWYKIFEKDGDALMGCHKRVKHHKVNPYVFPGYWCVEAAALTILFDLDDSRYRDHPHYPEEWADYARGQKFPLDFSERE